MSVNQGKYTQHFLGLPIINDIDDMSRMIRFPRETLMRYSHKNDKYYHRIDMNKKTGGVRHIESPIRELKAIQRWVLRNILDKLSPSIYSTGFVRGTSILSNAKAHEGNQYILNLDLKNFFTNVKAGSVYTVFRNIGYSKEVSFFLTSFCTKGGYLPQGAPTSPSLSNLVCLKLDYRIAMYCKKRALTYTRYADDICISGNKHLTIRKVYLFIKGIIQSEGFEINHEKKRLLGPRVRREVTGLTVTPKVTIGKSDYCKYRKRVHDLAKLPEDREREFYPTHIAQGIISFVRFIDEKKGERLSKYYDKIFNEHLATISC